MNKSVSMGSIFFVGEECMFFFFCEFSRGGVLQKDELKICILLNPGSSCFSPYSKIELSGMSSNREDVRFS